MIQIDIEPIPNRFLSNRLLSTNYYVRASVLKKMKITAIHKRQRDWFFDTELSTI